MSIVRTMKMLRMKTKRKMKDPIGNLPLTKVMIVQKAGRTKFQRVKSLKILVVKIPTKTIHSSQVMGRQVWTNTTAETPLMKRFVISIPVPLCFVS